MPQNVNNALADAIMPNSLCSSLVEVRGYPTLINEYPDGCSQRRLLAQTSRKRFRMGKRLTAAEMNLLRAFYIANIGKAFVVYPRRKDYDPSGQSQSGRYLMRFEGGWTETSDIGRGTAQIELVEVA